MHRRDRKASNKSMKRILATLLLLTLAAPAWGQDFEKGKQAYERGDYVTALREWRSLAVQGDAAGQYGLGSIYSGGRGVPQDYAEAVKWWPTLRSPMRAVRPWCRNEVE